MRFAVDPDQADFAEGEQTDHNDSADMPATSSAKRAHTYSSTNRLCTTPTKPGVRNSGPCGSLISAVLGWPGISPRGNTRQRVEPANDMGKRLQRHFRFPPVGRHRGESEVCDREPFTRDKAAVRQVAIQNFCVSHQFRHACLQRRAVRLPDPEGRLDDMFEIKRRDGRRPMAIVPRQPTNPQTGSGSLPGSWQVNLTSFELLKAGASHLEAC